MIVSSTQSSIASKMARPRGVLARRIGNFENRRFAAAKKIANARSKIIGLKSDFSHHKVRILMWKCLGMLWDEWELEDMQYFLLGKEIDSLIVM